MTTSLESMTFFTKLLTAMVLLLNIGLLVSIRLALKSAKQNSELDRSETGARAWLRSRRALMALIVMVVGMNATAIYANQKVVKATQDIAAQIPGDSDAELLLSMSR
jgi:uncharacterized BrkB/YihY/UPF0761 family membrane protein